MGAFVDFISGGIAVCIRNGFPLLVFCHVIVVHVTELTSEDYTFCIDFLGRYFGFDFLSVATICCPGNLFVGGLPYVYFQPVSE